MTTAQLCREVSAVGDIDRPQAGTPAHTLTLPELATNHH